MLVFGLHVKVQTKRPHLHGFGEIRVGHGEIAHGFEARAGRHNEVHLAREGPCVVVIRGGFNLRSLFANVVAAPQVCARRFVEPLLERLGENILVKAPFEQPLRHVFNGEVHDVAENGGIRAPLALVRFGAP